ncbi:hypothetical protein ACFRKE_00660 [Kitasatospora indigofera]|uniref:hypothetical protein n=1 Tax=Kitasatospora indigofera TaxID=67307 RepID=UPI0036AA2372
MPVLSRREHPPADDSLIASDPGLRRSRMRTTALRTGLWAAVAAGPLALAAVIAVPQSARSESSAPPSAPVVIAPPTGYAESFVDLWLRSADSAASDALHAMAPGVDLPKPATAVRATVDKTVAVRSAPMGGRTWQVTVAATIVLPPVPTQGEKSPQGVPQGSTQAAVPVPQSYSGAGVRVVRYFAVQVSMVRSGGAGGAPDSLAVTDAPAQIAAPVALAEADPAARSYGSQVADGPLRETVAGYLSAYLSGVGDSSRYLAPTARIPALGAAYSKVALQSLAAAGAVPSSPQDGAVLEVLAQVRAADGAGEWPLSYPLRLTARAGRWEVAAIAPAAGSSPSSPSLSGVPSPVSSNANGVR